MRRRQVLLAGSAAAVLLGTGWSAQAAPAATTASPGATPVAASAAAVGVASSFGRAIAVPGLEALNTGRKAEVLSVSCAAAGSCAASGYYQNHGKHGFVVSEGNGRWRHAIEVPGLKALRKGGSQVSAVSCASAGFCAAGGYYGNHSRNPYDVITGRGFVVSERNGRWHRAVEVPGLGALNRGGNAEVSSVSCASRGYCAAVGFYTDSGSHQQGFVAVEQSGVWGKAVEVPGLGALNTGGSAEVGSVSCISPGNCAAGGYYDARAAGTAGHQLAFVVSEQKGSWGTAQQAAANLSTGPGGPAFVDSVSCGSPGNCAAGGEFNDASGGAPASYQAFVISEVNGTWTAARAVAGTLSCCGGAVVTAVSCASAGNCAAGGQFDYGGYNAAFLVNEKNGAWGKLMYVPGLNKVSRDAYLSSVSCASAENCAAGGSYDLGVFVAVERNGVWGKQTTMPGRQVDGVNTVSCASARICVAAGSYVGPGPGYSLQGFVTQ
jgi:hypothetical protein